MPKKRSTIVILAGLAGLGLYQFRRQLIGRSMHLRPPRYAVDVQYSLQIPMPDGVMLGADLYTPRSGRLFPTLLLRTPYGRGARVAPSGLMMSFTAQRFAERGYNVLVQDTRGRFGSQGEFIPFVDEAADGRATLAWIEDQDWCNGLLGMWGASYMGYSQWAAATGASPALKALVPAVCGSNMPVSFMNQGAFGLDTTLRWMYELDAMNRRTWLQSFFGLGRMAPFVMERRLIAAANHLPLKDVDRLATGKAVSFYQEWLKHPQLEDPFWQAADHSGKLDDVTAAAHFISGWYDLFLRDLLADYAALRRAGQHPYLTIGPWYHMHPELSQENLRQGIVWFDAVLKGDRRNLRQAPVRVYVMGANEWREYPDWPPPAQLQAFHLHPGGGLSVEPLPEQAEPDTYLYNPLNPTPSLGGPLLNLNAGPVDNRPLEARSDVLTFTGDVLDSPLEVIGPVRAALYVRSDRESSDFFVRLCDVAPNGVSTNLCDGFMRLKPGIGEVQADGSLLIELDLWATAHRFLAGHRLRLLVSSGAHPRFARNPGNGLSLTETDELLPAQQAVYHDRHHPSAVFLPVVTQNA